MLTIDTAPTDLPHASHIELGEYLVHLVRTARDARDKGNHLLVARAHTLINATLDDMDRRRASLR